MKAVEGYAGLGTEFCFPGNPVLHSDLQRPGCTSRKNNTVHCRVCRCAAGLPRRNEPPSAPPAPPASPAILVVQNRKRLPMQPIPWLSLNLQLSGLLIATAQSEVGVLEIGSWTDVWRLDSPDCEIHLLQRLWRDSWEFFLWEKPICALPGIHYTPMLWSKDFYL